MAKNTTNLQPILCPTKSPNAVTKRAVENAEKGIGLIPCDDIEDLWEKLGLDE